VEWSLGEIKFFIDGQLVHTINNFDEPNATQHPGPFDIENYLILNMAVGGDYLNIPYNDANNSINQLPATMEVDWVRVYQIDETSVNCEKLYNGEFTNNGEGWFVREFFDASGTFNNGFILIDNPGTAIWHLALRQEGFMLENGKSYEVKFEAYTEDTKNVSIIISNIDGTQYHYEPYTFTGGNLESYSFQFTMNGPTNVNTVFNFNVGGDFNWVAVNNFSLKELNCLPCTPILDINNQTIISGTYSSADQINSNGVIISNDEVLYRSNLIQLNSNFEVEQGASFDAIIDPCGN